MVEGVVEIGAHLPTNSLLDRKFFVDGHIPDVQNLASYVGKNGREIPQRKRGLSLRRENGGVEPHVIGRIELLAASFLRIGVPLAVVKVGRLRHQVGRIGKGEGESGMNSILRVQVPSPGYAIQQRA